MEDRKGEIYLSEERNCLYKKKSGDSVLSL